MLVPINLKTEVVTILTNTVGLADFSTDYPDDFSVFPYAIYRTLARPKEVNNKREEIQTQWVVTIELYGKKSLTVITNDILARMRRLGFQVDVRDANVAGLKRNVLTAHIIVDNVTRQTYLPNI